MSDVTWDESAKAFVIEMALSVPDPAAAGAVGVLKALIDTQQLFAAVAGVRVAGAGEHVLVRRDGTVVFSRESTDPTVEYFAADLLRERIGKVRPGDVEYRSHFPAASVDGRLEIVALAPTQLIKSYPNLPWLVAASESEDELFAPVRTQVRNLLLVLAMAATMFLIAIVWWSIRLAAPPDPDLAEMELHLAEHPRVARIDDVEEASLKE